MLLPSAIRLLLNPGTIPSRGFFLVFSMGIRHDLSGYEPMSATGSYRFPPT
jgi:hypothetical protein